VFHNFLIHTDAVESELCKILRLARWALRRYPSNDQPNPKFITLGNVTVRSERRNCGLISMSQLYWGQKTERGIVELVIGSRAAKSILWLSLRWRRTQKTDQPIAIKCTEFTVRETSHSQQLENLIFGALPQNDAHLLTTQ